MERAIKDLCQLPDAKLFEEVSTGIGYVIELVNRLDAAANSLSDSGRRVRSRGGARVRTRKPKPAARGDRQHATRNMLFLILAGIAVIAGFVATVWLRDLLPNF